MEENPLFLKEQIITYLGNKRSLLGFIEKGIEASKTKLGKDKIISLDLFSGSGIVARYLKKYSSILYVNDLEGYSKIINDCYLSNIDKTDLNALRQYHKYINSQIKQNWKRGIISENYSPMDDKNIKMGERCFYTRRNAEFIDTARFVIGELPKDIQKFFIAPLLYGASVHVNTSGIFKGFYKNKEGVGQFGGSGRNALSRITKDIKLNLPVLSNFNSDVRISQKDAFSFSQEMEEVDFAYLDPPYNQHPYGSNYFMLNLILENKMPENYSKVSGIPNDWNRSLYNKKESAKKELFSLIDNLKAKFILVSYNSEGFISMDEFVDYLSKLGELAVIDKEYNTFRGCRNIKNRPSKVKEFLFLLEKR